MSSTRVVPETWRSLEGKHSWCSGNIGSSHGLAPGSTPGGCTYWTLIRRCSFCCADKSISAVIYINDFLNKWSRILSKDRSLWTSGAVLSETPGTTLYNDTVTMRTKRAPYNNNYTILVSISHQTHSRIKIAVRQFGKTVSSVYILNESHLHTGRTS